MGEAPDRIRQDIERTRAELTEDTDRLVNRVDPRQAIERRKDRVRRRAQGLRERVMGSKPSSQAAMSGIRRNAEQVGEAARSAPRQAVEQTRGNPLAAGLIAFGAGLLAASLLSESEAERRAAQQAREYAPEMVDSARRAVSESAERVRDQAVESAREAGEHLKESATDAAHSTGEQARDEVASASRQGHGS
ncbi:uncharacterized protein DUF3618 [Nocardiopsis sp. Huas11]|uniref:DUF3618 domain-containing protein n=1 Tax=Nocardiopsis sp. Huas11 TaxID=2183912 RepID=UPI000EB13D59|nr:DUF3618 domain-containing protein [Nocardiopsis sp. Huas11]RKS08366.1 uncharacterized protein DUF3618 [Nocardiopsis sp. Huas11]